MQLLPSSSQSVFLRSDSSMQKQHLVLQQEELSAVNAGNQDRFLCGDTQHNHTSGAGHRHEEAL